MVWNWKIWENWSTPFWIWPRDWAKRIDIILEAGGDAILNDAGKITAEFAKSFAESEFEKYRIIQDRLFKSDFDRLNDCDLLNTIE